MSEEDNLDNSSQSLCDGKKPTLIQRKSSRKKLPNIQNVGLRLARRKHLFQKRRNVNDACVLFAIAGIMMMLINTELTMIKDKSNPKELHVLSMYLKLLVTLSTVILLALLVWFHQLDLSIFMIDNAMEDWRLALTLSHLLLVCLELLVCAVHPVPGSFNFSISNLSQNVSEDILSLDILLSLPMFLRFFLVCRALMLHSHMYQDVSAQSLGALNRIQFNFVFIFKSVMSLYAEYVLTIMILFLFLWASWAVRACESNNQYRTIDFLDSMWLIAITFLTVGYGDLVPSTICGKAVTVLTGIFGVGCTALVVAVLSKKLEFSRSQMYVHNFIISVDLGKQMKHAAANVLKEGWLTHKYRKENMRHRALKHERRLIQAIRRIREIKADKSRLSDNSLTMVELNRTQNSTEKTVEAIYLLVQQIQDNLMKSSRTT